MFSSERTNWVGPSKGYLRQKAILQKTLRLTIQKNKTHPALESHQNRVYPAHETHKCTNHNRQRKKKGPFFSHHHRDH